MIDFTDPDTRPFAKNETVVCVKEKNILKNGKHYKISTIEFIIEDDEWMVSVVGVTAKFYASRFAKIEADASGMKSSNVFYFPKQRQGYGLESHSVPAATVAERKKWLELRKFRKIAAVSYLFEKGPGQKIRGMKEELTRKYLVEKVIVNPKYNIRLPYIDQSRKSIIREYRACIARKRRELREIQDEVSNTGWSRLQGIHHTPGGVVNVYYKKALIPTKFPKNEDSHIGIEIECILPRDVNFAGLMVFKDQLSIGNDGSISVTEANHISKEIRLLTTVSKYQEDIEKLCSILVDMKAKVNSSCGLHVHLDMRQYSKDQVKHIYHNLVKSQKYLAALVDEKRAVNRYCKLTKDKDPYFERDRYKAINAVALRKFGTLEIRLHHGTLDSQEINNWISLLLSITKAEEIKRTAPTLAEFMNKVKVEEKLKTYIEKKIRLTPPTVNVMFDEVIQTTLRPGFLPCRLEHENEYCNNCGMGWESNHEGHNCLDEDGNQTEARGSFPGCVTATVPTRLEVTENV